MLLILTAVSLSGIQGLSKTKGSVVSVVDEVQPTVINSMELAMALEGSAKSLGFYLLTHEDRDKKAYLDDLAKVDTVLKSLKQQKLVQADADGISQALTHGLHHLFADSRAAWLRNAGMAIVDRLPPLKAALVREAMS